MTRRHPSRSTSRVHFSRASSHSSSIISLPGSAESLIVPEGPIGPATKLLGSSPLHESEGTSSTLVGDSSEEDGQKKHADVESRAITEVEAVEDSEDEDEEEILEREEMMGRPFFRRPSHWWILGTMFLAAIAMSTTLAPRVELYTTLACRAIKPEYAVEVSANPQRWGNGGILPPPSKSCGNDPDVQAAVAGLITIMLVSSGILSCLTTGWWGQLSDRYGRTRILGIATIGVLVTDFNLILVSRAADYLPGGYRFLLVGPAFDGLLGGMTTLIAGLHAYISDCTPADKRSHIFSLNTGLLFTGMALGPTFGGLLIEATNDLLSVFYLATASHLIYGFFIWFIIPESLPKSLMRRARKRRGILRAENANRLCSEHAGYAIRARIMNFVKTLFGFLEPLSIFVPTKRLRGNGREWSLTLMVVGFAFYGLLMGSYQFKFQYAQRAFGWDSEALGYWLSVVSISRATYLVLVLPLVIRLFKPKVGAIQLPVSPEEPLDPTRRSHSDSDQSRSRSRSLLRGSAKNVAHFDLTLARVSLAIELACYVGMALAKNPIGWTAASVLASFGSGFSPAMQSVALALYEQGPNKGVETGRLFGGLSVVQSLSAQIIGPSVFGFTYLSTVNIFPTGIFVVAAGSVAFALFSVSLVRLARGPPNDGHEREETAVAQEEE